MMNPFLSKVAGVLLLWIVGASAFTTTTSSPTAIGSCTQQQQQQSSRTSTTQLWMTDPLAQEGDWAAYLDDQTTGLVYYFNGKTGEALWEPPTKTFPTVNLTPDLRVVSQTKQKEYKKETEPAIVTEETGDKKGLRNLFGGRKKDTEEEVVVVEEQEESKPKRGILGRVFGGGRGKDESAINGDAVTATPEKKKKPVVTKETTTAPEDTTVKMDMSSFVLPHPAKASWGGEDAVFTKGRTFGVFDGVSGAEKLDGVPLYSVTLAKELRSMTTKEGAPSVSELTSMLTEAADFADKSATGASTAVVGSLSEQGDLSVLNVGDSQCIIVRDGKAVAKTRDIIHYFDCPYQLSEDSPDRPRDGTKLNVKVKKGDVILMGSDGIFDNLGEKQICEIVAGSKARASGLAKKVVDQSRRVSLDATAETPYAKLARRNGMEDYRDGLGGKLDDVSCVVVRCS